MDYKAIIASALVTGILTTLLNQTFNWLRENRAAEKGRQLKASHLALRLAITLETFALASADAIEINDMYEGTSGALGSYQSMPKLSEYPSEADAWTALDLTLASEALAFPLRVSLGRDAVAFEADLTGDHDSIANEVSNQSAKLGIEADRLAARLRRHYHIRPLDIPSEFRTTLSRCLKIMEEQERRRDKRDAEEMREAQSNK